MNKKLTYKINKSPVGDTLVIFYRYKNEFNSWEDEEILKIPMDYIKNIKKNENNVVNFGNGIFNVLTSIGIPENKNLDHLLKKLNKILDL